MPTRSMQKRDDDDCQSGGCEADWYDAHNHIEDLHAYCRAWKGKPWLQCLDIFSFHCGMQKVLGSMTSSAFDIKLEPEKHDITMKRGVLLLLALGMALCEGGLVTCAPPCSLFIFLSCSVHLRYLPQFGPYGDPSNYKVRLANLIVKNMVGFMKCTFSFKIVICFNVSIFFLFQLSTCFDHLRSDMTHI